MSAEKVLEVAIEAYWQNDLADVSVNSICRAAQVSKPSVYREFGNEDGLTHAALESYAEHLLSDLSKILQTGQGMNETLDALIDFIITDARLEIGCLFHKMRAGKNSLGPKTHELVEELNRAAQGNFQTFFQDRRSTGDWYGAVSIDVAAKYLGEQIALALGQRASGENATTIREILSLALSVFQ
jgi:AcrR family transcriptional regulator